MQLNDILKQIETEIQPFIGQGDVANYIPALAQVDPNQFAMSVLPTVKTDDEIKLAVTNLDSMEDNICHIGDADKRFSIQSVSKVLTLALVMSTIENEKEIWQRVGKEPSGMPFNSLIQLELEKGIPRNPLINPGAIVIADFLVTLFDDPVSKLKEFVSELSGKEVNFDGVVASSEKNTGWRNFSLGYLMKSFNNIENNVERVLEVYFNQCAISMSTNELAQAFSFLANDGVNPLTGKPVVTPRQSRRLNALMLTCGTYDRAGQFAFHVGLPAKSGVGGGIVAVVPDYAVISVWSPALGKSGNSVAGMNALEMFVQKTGLSVF